MNMDDLIGKFKTLEAEFDKMSRMVKDASDAFEAYQETIDKLESQFVLFRRMYWKLKDEMKVVQIPAIDDTAIIPPPDVPPEDLDKTIYPPKRKGG
jgi:hypothetical protein